MTAESVLILALLSCLVSYPALAQKPGEILFSNKTIDPANPVGLTQKFGPDDSMYAVAYFEKSLPGLVGKETAKKVNLEIFLYELKAPLYDYQDPSEMQLESCSLSVSGDALQNAYLVLDLVPRTENMTAYGNPDFVYKKYGDTFDGPVKFAKGLSKLEPGDHTIVVKVNCNYAVVSEGRFTLSGDDYAVLQARSKDLNDAASGLKTRETVMPGPAKSDPVLEKQMTAAFVASQTYQDRVKGEVLRVVIIDPDWMVRKHPITGIILHRYIRAAIAVKNSDGTCTLWQLVTFQQDYVSNKFQQMRFDGIGDPLKIPCENVHK